MKETDLNLIKSPADIRKMTIDELKALAAELRSALIKKLAAKGGHVGPNLGMVEATIALHYVFDTPKDKLVFDVSHQSYVHKMLTGRMEAFTYPAHYNDVTGYTNPRESEEYDLFSVGHTSSSLALASGLAKARDMAGRKENVVAVIGDASLGGGEAFEGLNYGATLGSNFIVVVNDNDMSIAKNHGGLYADLRLLRHSNGEGEPNFFRAMGYAYRYVDYGNDIASLVKAFEAVKDIDHPVVVHINTMKGFGLPVAESDKEKFHYSAPFDLATGAVLHPAGEQGEEADYTDFFASFMLDMMRVNPALAVLTAGTPGAVGFTPGLRAEAGKRFIDVGIAEQDATGMSAGLAKGGARPVFAVVSTFLQRAYDQLSQDVALNRLPAVFTVFHTGVYAMNDETHLGFFDIALISNIPEFVYLTPTCVEEYKAMLSWAISQSSHPVAVRTPGGAPVSNPSIELLDDYSEPRYETVSEDPGARIAIIGVGNFLSRAEKTAEILRKNGTGVKVINPRCVSALDKRTLDTLRDFDTVVTLEDGITDGGYGQKVAAYLGDAAVKVVCLGLPKAFPNRFNAETLISECGLRPDQIAASLMQK